VTPPTWLDAARSALPPGRVPAKSGRGGGASDNGLRCVARFVGRCLAVGVTALIAATARAQSIDAGTLELTIAAGGGASLPRHEVETVTSFHLLPHLGYFLTGEVGEGTLRGNFEILLEPILIYLDASNSATVVGVAVLPRWVFAASPRVRPYLEAGAGVLAGQVNLSQTNCDVNFILEAGGGAMIFMTDHVALTLGARFHQCPTQIAAAKTRESTPSLVIVGVSYFFR
jgi:hypothetical protein